MCVGLGQGMTPPGGLCSCCRGERCAGWGQPAAAAARRPAGVNQRHIAGSSRCPGGQQLGGFCRAWMLFWKSKTSVAGSGKGSGLSAFCKAKRAPRQGRLSGGAAEPSCMGWLWMALFPMVTSPFPSKKKNSKKGLFELIFSVPQSPGLSPKLILSSFSVPVSGR